MKLKKKKKQISYNLKNNITPKTVISKISDILADLSDNDDDKIINKKIKEKFKRINSRSSKRNGKSR